MNLESIYKKSLAKKQQTEKILSKLENISQTNLSNHSEIN